MVVQSWHLERRQIGRQYLALLARLRRTMLAISQGKAMGVPKEVLESAQKWTSPRKCHVRPLWVCEAISKLIHQKFKAIQTELSFHDECFISSTISVYLGSWANIQLPKLAFETFAVSPKGLQQVGASTRRRQKSSWVPMKGQLASARGKLVLMEKIDVSVDVGLVSSALDAYPYFSVGRAGDTCSWHLARLHHACRVMDPPEAPCEQVGSLLHRAWDEAQNLAPAPLVDRALLKPLSC